MGIRSRVSKLLTDVQNRGVSTPILSELAIPATVISAKSVTLPTLDAYRPEAISDIVNALKVLPGFAYGSASGPTAGQWYQVTYPKSISGAIPVCIGLGRVGSITTRPIAVVSDISPLEIARVTRDDFTSGTYCDKVATAAKNAAEALGPPWPLNLVWDFFCNCIYLLFYAAAAILGWMLNVLWDTFIQVQVDKVRDSINSVISSANTKIDQQLQGIQDAVNLRLNDLYSMWGLPTNIVPTPLHVRNVSDTGFQFQSYGNTTCYWIAMGQAAGLGLPSTITL